MPITKGAGNPDWTRDETILALELFHKHFPKLPDDSNKDVVELSKLLRVLPVHPQSDRKENFRNAHGVGLKLQNINSARKEIDLGEKPKISSCKMDRAVWREFGNDPERTARTAASIRAASAAILSGEEEPPLDDVPEDEEFPEGTILTRIHRGRERNKSLRRKALAAHKKSHGALSCVICATPGFPDIGEANEALFEVHHILPLSALPSGRNGTRLADVVVLCASCHRLIHRVCRDEDTWVAPQELRARLGKI